MQAVHPGADAVKVFTCNCRCFHFFNLQIIKKPLHFVCRGFCAYIILNTLKFANSDPCGMFPHIESGMTNRKYHFDVVLDATNFESIFDISKRNMIFL